MLDVLLDNMLMLASHIAVGGALVLNMLTVEPTTFSQDTSPMMLRRHAPEMSSVYRSQCREPSLRRARIWASKTLPISSRRRAAKERRCAYVCTTMRIERVKSTTRSWIAYVMRINRLFSFSMHEIIHLLENFVPAATRSAAITTHTFAAVDRNILTVTCSHFRNSAHLHDPVAGFRKFLGAGHGLNIEWRCSACERSHNRTFMWRP